MRRHVTAAMIFVSILPIDLTCVGIARSQEPFPWITRHGSWSLADERGRPGNRLSGLLRSVSYTLSLRNDDRAKNYRFGLSCISGVIRAEVDISNLSDTRQNYGFVVINGVTIDATSGRTTFSDSSTAGATVRNGFFEGELNQSMIDHLKQQTEIDIEISYQGYKESEKIPSDDTSEAISAFTSLCRQMIS